MDTLKVTDFCARHAYLLSLYPVFWIMRVKGLKVLHLQDMPTTVQLPFMSISDSPVHGERNDTFAYDL